MKRKASSHYQASLLSYLKQGTDARLKLANRLGQESLAAGLKTLDMAKLHEHILVTDVLPGCPVGKCAALIRHAGIFFAEAIVPYEKAHRSARAADAHLKKIVEALSRRTVELAASNLELSQEIAQRKSVEEALKKSERHYSKLLEQSERLQEQLRQLSRQILSAQEEERKRISRELHDVIAQTLVGINLRLATLKQAAAKNSRGLEINIARTQKLVEKSVNTIHEFARELRPAVLDDFGLIPALHSFMKDFTIKTGVHTHLTAFAAVEELDAARRTVFFRIAQEALSNVARHAKASRATVVIEAQPGGICMRIEDDGRSFDVHRIMSRTSTKRLGLLGMRERMEMVGGKFDVVSVPGKGTTITAQLPLGKAGGGGLSATT